MDAIGDIAVVFKPEAALKSECCWESPLKKLKAEALPEKSSDGSDGSNRSSITSEDLGEEMLEMLEDGRGDVGDLDALPEKSSDGSNRSSITSEDLDEEMLEDGKARKKADALPAKSSDGSSDLEKRSDGSNRSSITSEDLEDKSTEKDRTAVDSDEEEEEEDDGGYWTDLETVKKQLEELNKIDEWEDNFGYIQDETLKEQARAYYQMILDNPFDIDFPPPQMSLHFDKVWPQNPDKYQWKRAEELMKHVVETQQDKKGWKLSDLKLVKLNYGQWNYYMTFEAKHFPTDHETSTYQAAVFDDILSDGSGEIVVHIFKRKGEQDVGSAST